MVTTAVTEDSTQRFIDPKMLCFSEFTIRPEIVTSSKYLKSVSYLCIHLVRTRHAPAAIPFRVPPYRYRAPYLFGTFVAEQRPSLRP
jgi:hypothetical protein